MGKPSPADGLNHSKEHGGRHHPGVRLTGVRVHVSAIESLVIVRQAEAVRKPHLHDVHHLSAGREVQPRGKALGLHLPDHLIGDARDVPRLVARHAERGVGPGRQEG